MNLATWPIVLLSLLIGNPQGSPSHQARGTAEAGSCPTWFDRAPRLGPGRPDAVALRGLRAVTVCRFFENPHSAGGPGLPPNDKLAAEKLVRRPDTARSLGRAFNRLRPYPSQDAPYPDGQPPMRLCSSEFGGGFYLRFLYSDGRSSSVAVVPTGCPRAIAGKKGGWLWLSADLRLRLMKTAPLPVAPRSGKAPTTFTYCPTKAPGGPRVLVRSTSCVEGRTVIHFSSSTEGASFPTGAGPVSRCGANRVNGRFAAVADPPESGRALWFIETGFLISALRTRQPPSPTPALR